MNKIRTNDQVIILSGNQKGQQGRVTRVIGDSVTIEGRNLVFKTKRPNPQKGESGGIVKKEMPLHISNVMLVDSATGKGSRTGVKHLEDGRKVRYLKPDGEVVESNE